MTKKIKGMIAASLACAAMVPTLCVTMGIGLAEESATMPAYQTKLDEEVQALFDQTLANFNLELESLRQYPKKFNVDWEASYIEYVSPVWFEDELMYGIYIDFDGDNGYMVMTLDYTMEGSNPKIRNIIFSWITHGDLPCLRDGREIYFWDGLRYYVDGECYYLQPGFYDNLYDFDWWSPKNRQEK